MLFPAESNTTSKTGETDESVALDNPDIQFLNPLFEKWSRRPSEEKLVGLSYMEFYRIFTATALKLQVGLMASMGRGSGASIDRALKRRSLQEVQRQGRWKAAKSVTRYDKMNRLNHSWIALSELQRRHFTMCQAKLEKAILYGALPEPMRLETSSSDKPCATTSRSAGSGMKGASGAPVGMAGARSKRENTSRSTEAAAPEKRRNTARL
jgi:hypothetical protein